jgi:hypothetical protein
MVVEGIANPYEHEQLIYEQSLSSTNYPIILRFGFQFLVASTVNDTVVNSFYSSGKIRLLVELFVTIVRNIFAVLTI